MKKRDECIAVANVRARNNSTATTQNAATTTSVPDLPASSSCILS